MIFRIVAKISLALSFHIQKLSKLDTNFNSTVSLNITMKLPYSYPGCSPNIAAV